ncbi:hypothetical protein [Nocardia asteroides]|uniref:hypothetical protein n=1 Tax=Nocardia asteroides TaxID=1824 RepID=UPI00341F56BB
MTGPRSGAATRATAGRVDAAVLRDRRRIAHACEHLVPVVEVLAKPMWRWAGFGRWEALPPQIRADLGAHALAVLDTVLADLAPVRAQLAAALAAPPRPIPDPDAAPWPAPGRTVSEVYLALTYDRIAGSMRYISISLDQWAARTPDDYDETARATAGATALDFLDGHLDGFASVRTVLAAALAGPAT